MRTIQRASLLACALLTASCTSGSEITEPATPTAIDVVATETPTVVAEPTATPTPEPIVVTEADRIAAAVAAFEADPQPTELIAYDYLEPLDSTNQIRLTVCGWTGETVFDDVYQITYRVGQTRNNDGKIDVAFESANITLDTCTNTELIGTALQATRDYDNYWRGVLEDPTSFDEAEAAQFMVGPLVESSALRVAEWVDGGLAFQSTERDGHLPDSSVTDVLGRRWTEAGIGILELIACRDLPNDYGLYQGDLLIDNFKDANAIGEHATTQYKMIRQDGTWKSLGTDGLVWADCFAFDDGWFDGINRNYPEPGGWIPWSS